jgi:CRP-like cAMP-binding protein
MAQENKIEVSADLARQLIPILENQIQEHENSIASHEDDRDRLKRTLAELNAKLNGAASMGTNGANGARKRLPKGQAAKIVHDLLTQIPPGVGLKVQDIVKQTGVPYASVFRTLTKDKKHRFVQDNGNWRIAVLSNLPSDKARGL